MKEDLFIINISLLPIFDSFNSTNKVVSKTACLTNLANINKYNLAILKDFVIYYFVYASYIFFCIFYLYVIWTKKNEENI